jgi:branched-chain amino acid transport system ATP-binding protein
MPKPNDMSNLNSKPVLSLENIAVKVGNRIILENVSFDINAGEVVGIIGPNGCGKTTLLNAVSGFFPIDSGTISVNGIDVMNLPAHKRVKLGIARGFQHVGVFREMTVEENIMMVVERDGKYPWWWMLSAEWRKKMSRAVDTALDEVNLLRHKKSLAGVLSGGELRLLELTRLKIMPGNILLIDEPTAGVAPILRDNLAKMIKRLSKEHGRTVIIVEHDLRFLFNLAERIIVLVEGQKYLEGTPEEIRRDERLQKIYFGE